MGLCLGKPGVNLRATRLILQLEETCDKASSVSETHIHDLPDECLIEILRRLENGKVSVPISSETHEDMTVLHPIQCALVCRRWHTIADSAILTLSMRDVRLTQPLANHLGSRFPYLTSLKFDPLQAVAIEPLLTLAQHTPQIENLELPGGFESSLPAVAEALIKWKSLKRLNLGNHLWNPNAKEVESALDAICSLSSLRDLTFSYFENDLSNVCVRVGSLTGLEKLQLATSQVPLATSGHLSRTLRELALRNFKGGQLPDSLGMFTALETLCIEWSKDLTALPNSLGLLSRLTKLDVIECRRLASLPTTLGDLTSLKVLQVTHSIQDWPESLGALCSLHSLVLVGCEDLPRKLGPLTSLTNLRIDGFDDVKQLPKDIGDLPNLKTLDLSQGYGVVDLPHSLGRLSSLEILRLHSCPSLAVLPAALGMLTGLKELEVTKCGNHLEALPDSFKHLVGLEVCRISAMPCLRQLPEGISAWKRLVKLEISQCRSLRGLPEGLGQLCSLRELEIMSCMSLVSLPESLGKLSGLQVLRVRSCERLIKLPETLGNLSELQVLEVWMCNALEPLPESLKRLSLQFNLTYS